MHAVAGDWILTRRRDDRAVGPVAREAIAAGSIVVDQMLDALRCSHHPATRSARTRDARRRSSPTGTEAIDRALQTPRATSGRRCAAGSRTRQSRRPPPCRGRRASQSHRRRGAGASARNVVAPRSVRAIVRWSGARARRGAVWQVAARCHQRREAPHVFTARRTAAQRNVHRTRRARRDPPAPHCLRPTESRCRSSSSWMSPHRALPAIAARASNLPTEVSPMRAACAISRYDKPCPRRPSNRRSRGLSVRNAAAPGPRSGASSAGPSTACRGAPATAATAATVSADRGRRWRRP